MNVDFLNGAFFSFCIMRLLNKANQARFSQGLLEEQLEHGEIDAEDFRKQHAAERNKSFLLKLEFAFAVKIGLAKSTDLTVREKAGVKEASNTQEIPMGGKGGSDGAKRQKGWFGLKGR